MEEMLLARGRTLSWLKDCVMEIPDILKRLAVAVYTRKETQSRLYHLFLTHDSVQQEPGKGYRALASLLCQGYFATILTSNMDQALEEALAEEGLPASDYDVLMIGKDANDQILDALEEPQSRICIIKLPCTQSRSEQGALADGLAPDIQVGLQNYFDHNILIVGSMDQEEEAKAALELHGDGGIYYALQKGPHYNDIVVKCINKQNKRPDAFIIDKTYGEFNTFFSALELLLNDSANWRKTVPLQPYVPAEEKEIRPPRNQATIKLSPLLDEKGAATTGPLQITRSPKLDEKEVSTTGPLLPSMLDEKEVATTGPLQIKLPAKQRTRSTVFISYSHRDTEYLDRLLVHLKPLERSGLINVIWSDKNIKAGEKWHEEIMQAIASATIAVLLVSADFFASDFITRFELPPLEEAADKGEMFMLPVLTSHCNYEHHTLSRFQSVNNPSTPLSKTSYDTNEKVWKEVAARIKEIATAAP